MTNEKRDRILILQFRTDDSKPHEQKCYEEEFSNHHVEFDFFDVIQDELPVLVPEHTRGVILAGSSEFYLSDEKEKLWLEQTYKFIDRLLEKNIPILGVCFGYQILITHQGAKMVQDLTKKEVGAFDIHLTDEAHKDPLFKNYPNTFKAMLGHKDSPLSTPDCVTTLAYSEKVTPQVFKVNNKKAWGCLFHPELNKERMKGRLMLAPDYANNAGNLEEFIKNHFEHDTPEATDLLWRFVDYAISDIHITDAKF